jgi:hypothetical protein
MDLSTAFLHLDFREFPFHAFRWIGTKSLGGGSGGRLIFRPEWAKEGVALDWEKLMAPKGFQVLPRRWVVERTFSWIDQNRRMSKDYERLCASGEALVYAAMIRLMTRRLARV